MRYRRMEALNADVSALCMGTMNLGVGADEALSFELLDAFVAMGGNFIDTARVYGAFETGAMGVSERVIGRWMRARGNRARLILATKGGYHDMATRAPRLDGESLRRDLQDSLAALDVPSVDIYWLHRDDPARAVGDILETLHGFVEQRKVRAIGVSNWSPARIREAQAEAKARALTPIGCDQPLWSLARAQDLGGTTLYEMDAPLYRLHAESGLLCVPYSAQAKGFFLKLLSGGEAALGQGVCARYLCAHNRRLFDALVGLSGETGLSVGALTLRFLTEQTAFPVCPIVGASSLAQMTSLAEGIGDMPPEAMRDLMALSGLNG